MIAGRVREELDALAAYAIPHPAGIRARLDANESPFALPPDVAAELGAHLAGVSLNRYPDGKAKRLRAVLAREAGCDPAQLIAGNGSDELIAMLLDVYARPRDGRDTAGAAWPAPSFVFYRIATLGRGQRVVEIPLGPDFTLDAAVAEETITREAPNVVFFALPNNPTGTMWPRAAILELAERHRDTVIVADEAYFAYSGATVLDALPQHPNLVILRTLSKIGLAALRVGFLIAHPDVIATLERIRPPYNVGSLAQAAAMYLLEHHRPLLEEQVRTVVAERGRVTTALASGGIAVFPTQANFALVRLADASGTWRRLAERGVLVRNFDRPGPLAGCLRLTIGTPEENDLLLAALLE